jgi:hypothetical protein
VGYFPLHSFIYLFPVFVFTFVFSPNSGGKIIFPQTGLSVMPVQFQPSFTVHIEMDVTGNERHSAPLAACGNK